MEEETKDLFRKEKEKAIRRDAFNKSDCLDAASDPFESLFELRPF